MSRSTRLKLGYLVALAAIVALVAWVLAVSKGAAWAVPTMVAALLIPGRVQGIAFRDLFRGRHALDMGDAATAVAHLECFLVRVRARPSLKPLLWLSWSVWTVDPEAMALNNLGVARMAMGALEQAERDLTDAQTLDPLYPMPEFNLAVLASLRNDRATAELHAARARSLGYAGGTIDQAVSLGQRLLAGGEGRF